MWSSIYEKVKQHWRWVEKSIAYKKSVYINFIYLDSKLNTLLNDTYFFIFYWDTFEKLT